MLFASYSNIGMNYCLSKMEASQHEEQCMKSQHMLNFSNIVNL